MNNTENVILTFKLISIMADIFNSGFFSTSHLTKQNKLIQKVYLIIIHIIVVDPIIIIFFFNVINIFISIVLYISIKLEL